MTQVTKTALIASQNIFSALAGLAGAAVEITGAMTDGAKMLTESVKDTRLRHEVALEKSLDDYLKNVVDEATVESANAKVALAVKLEADPALKAAFDTARPRVKSVIENALKRAGRADLADKLD